MAITRSRVPTTHGSKYLQQLCKHWSHKMEVRFDPNEGEVRFPSGPVARMTAEADALVVEVETTPDNMAQMQGVVARHLDRFAFREAPLPFDWQDA